MSFRGDPLLSHDTQDAATCAFVLHRDGSFEEVAKGVGVVAVIVLVAGFDNVGRRVLFAVVVMLSKNRSLYEAPEALNRVCVNQSLCVGNRMIDCEVRHPFVHPVVAAVFVRYQQGVISLYETAQERLQRLASNLVGRLGYYLAAPCQRSQHRLFLGAAPALGRNFGVLVVLARLAADVGFVGFDNAIKEHAVIDHRLANLHSHPVGRRLGDVQVTGQLATGYAFLGVQQNRDCQEPLLQRYAGCLENRTRQNVVTAVALVTVPAAYSVILMLARYVIATTERANRIVAPACFLQVVDAMILCREPLENRDQIHRISPRISNASIP